MKYVGSSLSHLPVINKYIPKDITLIVEPFCGSAALSFSKDTPFILTDKSPELINFYKCIMEDPSKVFELATELAERHSKEFFLESRQVDRLDGFNSSCAYMRASRYIYLSYFGFNGLQRVNSKGFSNTPYGGDSRSFPRDMKKSFTDASEHLNKYCKSVRYEEFDNIDVLISHVDAGDNPFVLIDPPYEKPDSGKTVFQQYTTTKIDEEFYSRLTNYMEDLNEADIPFLMTNTFCNSIKERFSNWTLDKVDVNYKVGAKGDYTGCKFEYFVSNKGQLNDTKYIK
jgi:DNA adenine methylase